MPLKITKRLQPGNWFEMNYAGQRRQFCTLRRRDNRIDAQLRTLPSFKPWFTDDKNLMTGLYADGRNLHYLGKGKLRWWRHLIPAHRILGICDYSFPKYPRE